MTKAGCHCDKMPDKNCFALFKYFITVMRKVTNTDTSHPNTLTESSCAFSPYCSFILCLSHLCMCTHAHVLVFLYAIDSLPEAVLFFYHVGYASQSQVVRLRGSVYLLSNRVPVIQTF